MKEFLVYTGLRLGIFLGSLLVVGGTWALWVVVLAFLLSGVASLFLLNRQREAFAQRVSHGAERASARYEQARAKEDEPG